MRFVRNLWSHARSRTVRHSPTYENPRIDRLVVVAGACASGKSTLCEQILRNGHQELLDADMASAPVLGAKLFRKTPAQTMDSGTVIPSLILHYDVCWLYGRGGEYYAEDPSTAVMRFAAGLDIILVVPPLEKLMRQLRKSESAKGEFKKTHHRLYEELYERPGWLIRLYENWIGFCTSFVPHGQYMLYLERAGRMDLDRCKSGRDAIDRIKLIYGDVIPSRAPYNCLTGP